MGAANRPGSNEAFAERLGAAVKRRGNAVVVGLDPRYAHLPPLLRKDNATPAQQADAFRRFCCGIIDVVADKVPAVKPQMAFFEELGPPGMQALADVIQYARAAGLLVILDGKRNDIGSTASAYARAYLGAASAWQADALTVSPYLGDDSLEPFVEVARSGNAGLFVLVKTSNPGGRTFQDLVCDRRTLYDHVARLVERWAQTTCGPSGYGIVGAVVGATFPQQLSELREAMPHAWLLVPGYGAQGGAAADVEGAFDHHGLGAIINSSRAIIFAHERPENASIAPPDWQRAVELATDAMIAQLGRLPRLAELNRFQAKREA
jgi:orotidine-5'-phosphate decarboxylase